MAPTPINTANEWVSNVSDVSKTVFAEGRGICRETDSISMATSNAPCTQAEASEGNLTVFVGG